MANDSAHNCSSDSRMRPPDLQFPLAHGRTADVYTWAPGQVVKLYQTWVTPTAIQHEATMTRFAQAAGVPAPAGGQMVQIGARTGIVYAQVEGQSMLAALQRRPWTVGRLARQLAELHSDVHTVMALDTVPALVDVLAAKIKQADTLSAAQRRAVSDALDGMSTGRRLCHGDFHPDNVILGETETVIIDWADATRGRPAADVARTSIILRGAAETVQIDNPWLRVLARRFHDVYCARYFQLHPDDVMEYRQWLPLVAAARLCEQIPGQEEWLLRITAGSTSRLGASTRSRC